MLYLISVGLSVTLGLMGFVNLAHGIFAMAGGYLAAVAITAAGVPWPAMVVAGAHRGRSRWRRGWNGGLYARLYGRSELDQVLFSIGLIFIAGAVARMLFGNMLRPIPVPLALTHPLQVGPFGFYLYKLVVIGVGPAGGRLRRVFRVGADTIRRDGAGRGREPRHGGVGRPAHVAAVHGHVSRLAGRSERSAASSAADVFGIKHVLSVRRAGLSCRSSSRSPGSARCAGSFLAALC